MKSRSIVYGLALLLLLLVVMLVLRFPPHRSGQESPATTQNASNVLAGSGPIQNTTVQSSTNVAPPPAGHPIPPSPASRQNPQEVTERFVEGKNVPIEFYGQVIDQDSNALAGVQIEAQVVQLTMPDPAVVEIGSKSIPVERVTGADGRFEINGVQGASFDLDSIKKVGYEAEPTKRGHGPTGGSLDQPVMFKMWSTNIHQQLVTGDKSFPIQPDGRLYFIDLTAGTISETGGGDLKLWVKRPQQIAFGQKYDWSCELDVVNGGLLAEPAGASMNSAPPDGYAPSFQFQQTVGSGWGDTTGPRNFFVRVNGQEYGRISIEMYANYNNQIPGMVHLSYAINPSGSATLR